MNWFIRWVLFALSVMLVAWVIPGISVSGFLGALIVAVVLGLINILIKPIIYFISIPLNVATLGLFSFVINALLLMLAGNITPGFSVNGFWSALFGSILLALLSVAIDRISPETKTI